MRHIFVFLMIIFLGASASWGIEVELKNGRVMQVDRLSFDGETVTLFKDDSKHLFKSEDIKYFNADTKEQKLALGKVEKLQKEVDELRDDIKMLEGDLLKAVQDLIKERTRYGELLEEKRKMEKTLSDTDVDTLQKDMEKLEKDKQQLTQTLNKLQDELRVAKAMAGDARNGASKISVDRMKTSEAKFEKSETEGLVSIMGRVNNTADKSVGAIVIEVTALDQEGTPLASRMTHVLNVEPGTHATWRTDLEADYEQISQLQTRVADVLVTLPE